MTDTARPRRAHDDLYQSCGSSSASCSRGRRSTLLRGTPTQQCTLAPAYSPAGRKDTEMSMREGTLFDFIRKTEWQAFGPMSNYWVELQRQYLPAADYYERAARCFECDERIKDEELAEILNVPMTAEEELEGFGEIVCPLDYLEHTEYI